MDIQDQAEPAPLNAAAHNQVNAAEQEAEKAYSANSEGVRRLAAGCRKVNARLVHFSPDYVFDGTAGRPYTEEDQPRPLSVYGTSKLAGEFYALAYAERALIIRTSGVYGPAGAHTNRGNFVEAMLRKAASGQPISRCTRSMRIADLCPSAGDLHSGSGEVGCSRDCSRRRRTRRLLV